MERGNPIVVSGDDDLLLTDSPRIPAIIRLVDFLNLNAKNIPESTHSQVGNCQSRINQNVKSMTINLFFYNLYYIFILFCSVPDKGRKFTSFPYNQ